MADDFNIYGRVIIAPDGTAQITALNSGLRGLATTGAAASSGFASWAASMASAGQKMSAVGRTLTTHVSLPIAAIGVATAKMAYTFEESMTKMGAMVGVSEKGLARFRKGIMDLGPAVGKGPQELADSLYFITSSGFKGASAMKALTASAKASAAGLGDTITVADATTSAINAYGEKALSASKATAIMLAAVREGKNEPEELASSIGGVIPVASAMGVSFGEVAGTMAALSLNGTNASEAVTQITAGLSQSIRPTKKGAEALATLGMSYSDLRNDIKSRGLMQVFEDLKRKFHGNVEAIGKVFGNIRALRGVLTLTGASSEKYAGIVRRVSAATNDADVAFKRVAETAGFKMRQALSKLQVIGIGMGDNILPVFADIAQSAAKMGAAFLELSPAGQQLSIKLAAAAAAAGPLLWVFGKLASTTVAVASGVRTVILTVGALSAAFRAGGTAAASSGLTEVGAKMASLVNTSVFGKAATQATVATRSFAALGSSLAAMLGPVGLTIAAVAGTAGLGYGISKLGDYLSGATARVNAMKKAVSDLESDSTGKLQQWADKVLGGHLVSDSGTITWKPAVTLDAGGKTGLLAEWVKEDAAKAHAAQVEALSQQKLDQAKSAQAYFEGEAQKIVQARKGPGGADPTESDAYKDAMAQAEKYSKIVSRLSGKLNSLKAKDYRIKLGAHVDDLRTAIRQQEAKVKQFAKGPHSVKMDLKEDAARRKLESLKRELSRFTGKHHEGLLLLKIEKAQSNLKAINKALESARAQARKGVDVDAKIDRLTKAKAKASAQLKALQSQKTEPKVTLDDQATGEARTVRATLVNLFANPIIQTVTVKTQKIQKEALGGSYLVSKPTLFMAGEAGPEYAEFTPLNAAGTAKSAGKAAGSKKGAGSVASSATKVAKAAANAVSKGLGGVKGSQAKKVVKAAEVSGAVGTLVDFVASMSETLAKLADVTVPKLAAGWKTQVKKIVAAAIKVGEVVAKELNRAYKWTPGRAKTKKREATDPKVGKKGRKAQQAAEMTGPLSELVSFVADMSDVVEKLNEGIPSLAAGAKAAAKTMVDQVVQIAGVVTTALKGSKVSSAAAEQAQLVADVVSPLTTMIDVVEAMNEGVPAFEAASQQAAQTLVSQVISFASLISSNLAASGATQAMADSMGILGNVMSPITSMIDGLDAILGWAGSEMEGVREATIVMCDMIVDVVGIMNEKLGGLKLSDSIVTVLTSVASAMSSISSISSSVGGSAASSASAISSYTTNTYYSMTVNSASQSSSVIQDFATMKAIHAVAT